MALGDFLDRLGPTLASGIILAVLAGSAATALAWRDHVSASAVRFGNFDGELARLRHDLEEFRKPGGRFTVHDGARLQGQLDDHERRLREQETRPPRLSPALTGAVEDIAELKEKCLINAEAIKHILTEQERLCARLRQCDAVPRR